jgi:hypothetical protein
VRVLALAAALATLALVSGFAAYEWRSSPEPARVEPVQLLPEREPGRELPGKWRQANGERDIGGAPSPAPRSSDDGGAPEPPAPAPAGDRDDDARDDDGSDDDDRGDDGGGHD